MVYDGLAPPSVPFPRAPPLECGTQHLEADKADFTDLPQLLLLLLLLLRLVIWRLILLLLSLGRIRLMSMLLLLLLLVMGARL